MFVEGIAVLFYGLLATSVHPQTESVWCNATGNNIFHCEGGGCISGSKVCDKVPDCPTGNDEATKHCGCLPNEFQCSNTCIDEVKRCDRKADCPSGEDELDCKRYLCPVTHFKCGNDFCVPLDVVCNFVNDCGDNSDEIKCLHRSCWKPEFRCNNGECIRPGYVCDGTPHCKDSSDETDCHPSRFVDCGDGTRKHSFYWCDGWPDCPENHADEINCTACLGDGDYLCPNGRCISRASLCDSQCDCLPTSTNQTTCVDELDCDQYYKVKFGVVECGEDSLVCREKAERCLRGNYICDGVVHCHSFPSDESGCEAVTVGATPGSIIPGSVAGGESVFRCMDGRYLPDRVVCDFRIDCLHGDDELVNCSGGKMQCEEDEWRCNNGQCIPANRRCDIVFDCFDKSDEKSCQSFVCGEGKKKCELGGQCLDQSSWCDFFVDCPDQTDEQYCSSRECWANEFRCSNGQCIPNSERCFHSGLSHSGCADSSHLLNCSEWECPEHWFKCPGGPCINESLVCNSKIDCPDTWEDEDNCYFTCANSATECECKDVHINCTGRGLLHVPVDAEKEITWFHLGSNRLNYSLSNETFQYLDRVLYLDLSNNSIGNLVPKMFSWLWRLQVLNLQYNHLTTLDSKVFFGLPSLRALHLKGNKIALINSYAFYGLSSLPNLDLNGQGIITIKREAFVGLRHLTYLDLSDNKLTIIEGGTLIGMPHLVYLDISKNRIKLIESNAFKMARLLEKLVTDEFRLCCLAREVKVCLPPADEFSSCEDLMSNLVLRVCVWVLASIAILGNILVIACRASYKHTNQVHSFLITNLALGDLLMGSYLLLIALVDLHYRGVYSLHDSSWRSSTLCSLAGFISTFSSELSVFTLTVITLDRFLVIIFPFRVRRLEMARTRRLMAFGWILAASLSAIPLLQFDYFKNFYGRSGVCLALHITPDKPSGWEYSVFVFLFLNLVSFTIIAVGYLWMFLVARTTQHAVVKDRRASEAAMAWRMTLLVATDAACWVPIILLGLVSLAGQTVPRQVFAWVAVFVLPLNAAVNPVLYTLSTAPFLTPARHRLHTFRRSCKMSLSVDNRRTISSNVHSHNFTQSRCTDIELCTPPKTAVRWRNKNGHDLKLSSGETLLPLREVT